MYVNKPLSISYDVANIRHKNSRKYNFWRWNRACFRRARSICGQAINIIFNVFNAYIISRNKPIQLKVWGDTKIMRKSLWRWTTTYSRRKLDKMREIAAIVVTCMCDRGKVHENFWYESEIFIIVLPLHGVMLYAIFIRRSLERLSANQCRELKSNNRSKQPNVITH